MGRARGQHAAVAAPTRANDQFDAVLGTRRGDERTMARDGEWVALMTSLRARDATDATAVDRLAHTMADDAHAGHRRVAGFMAQRCGVGGSRALRIVTSNGKTLHLLAEPFGEQEGPHPQALCGRKLDGYQCREARRGDWQRDDPDATKRCSRCHRRASEVPEASEHPDRVPPLYPDAQKDFDAAFDARAQTIAASALDDHNLNSTQVSRDLDTAYTETLLDHAVAAAERQPLRALRAAYAKNPDCFKLSKELERLTGYPGDLEPLLAEVEWRPLFEPAVPSTRTDQGYNTGVGGWEDYRSQLRDQLIPIAAEHAQAERKRQAGERLAAAEAEMAGARAAVDEAQQPWKVQDPERII